MDTHSLMDLDYKLVGQNIKRLRKSKKLTQDMLAEQSDISKQYLAMLESGNKKGRLGIYFRIAVSLDVTLDILVGSCAPQNTSITHAAILERIQHYSPKQFDKLLDYMDYLDHSKK